MPRVAPLVACWLLLTSAAAGAIETRPLRGLRAEVAALLLQGVPGGGLPIAAAVFPTAAAGASAGGELTFLVEVPAAPPAETGDERPLEVYAYAIDAAGEVSGYFAVTLPDWPTEGEGVKISGRLRASPGELSVRFLAWDGAARRYGMVVRQVAARRLSSPPRVGEKCADWAVADGGVAELSGISARPVLVSGDRQRLSLGRIGRSPAWRVRLVRARDGATISAEVSALVVAAGELEFMVPDLTPGIYQLSLIGTGAEARGSPELESWLVDALPPADGGCRRSWGRILRQARGGLGWSEPAAAVAAPSRAPDGALAEFEADYQALLRRLAALGDLSAAAGELAELEATAVSADISWAQQMFTTEVAAAGRLADRDPRSLLPLVALHAEAYGVHHRAGRFPLATHSRRLAVAIADLAADSLTAPEELALVAVAYTGLANIVETWQASLEAQRLLERALSLDDGLEAARLLLGVSYERRGRYKEARQALEALISVNSAHFEGRVRLAILLRRMGEAAEAERLLRAVLAERPPSWLLSLAYQTLAQVLIRDQRYGEAAAVLEDGRRRLPDDQVLRILEAYALDRKGDWRSVRRTLAELPLGSAGVTPRYRYSDRPAAAVGLMRETLRQSVTVRLPILALALGSERPVGGAP